MLRWSTSKRYQMMSKPSNRHRSDVDRQSFSSLGYSKIYSKLFKKWFSKKPSWYIIFQFRIQKSLLASQHLPGKIGSSNLFKNRKLRLWFAGNVYFLDCVPKLCNLTAKNSQCKCTSTWNILVSLDWAIFATCKRGVVTERAHLTASLKQRTSVSQSPPARSHLFGRKENGAVPRTIGVF